MWMAQRSDGLRPETGKSLYQAIVRPVLEYGSEIWTTTKGLSEELEKVQRMALRKIVGCRISVKTSMLMNELGALPLRLRRDMAVIRLFNKLKLHEKGSVLNAVLCERMESALANPSGRGFCSRALGLLGKYGLSYAASISDAWKPSVWSEVVTEKVTARALADRRDNLREEADEKKKKRAELYLDLRPEFASSVQPYLRVPPRRVPDARLQFQLRVGASDLRAHCFGLADSSCPLCESSIEDTDHFMLHCPAYRDLKEHMLTRINARAQKFAYSPSQTVAFLLSSSRVDCPPALDKELTRYVQRFIVRAFRRRRELIQRRDFQAVD